MGTNDPSVVLDGVCDDGGQGSFYDICLLGSDCADCGTRDYFPPSSPPQPPQRPPPPPPAKPPPNQLVGTGDQPDIAGDGFSDDPIEIADPVTDGYAKTPHRLLTEPPPLPDLNLGQYFAGALDAIQEASGDRPPFRYLDWELVPVSLLGKGVSYTSDYMASKPAEIPSLPWYGYSFDGETYGVWMRGPSALLSHAGFMLVFHEGTHGGCPLLMSYLQPKSRLWRLGLPPFTDCCADGALNRTCLPAWLQVALAPNQTSLHSPGVLHDPEGHLPSRDGNLSQHFAIYYSTAPSTADAGLACIGRISGRWVAADGLCAPTIEWEDDGEPVLCSNSASSMSVGHEEIADVAAGTKYNSTNLWRTSSNGEALAHAAEPFFGLDGSLYMVYGARAPGDIRIVQLNESTGRLPTVAQPGFFSAGSDGAGRSSIYHHVATGPNFQLGPDRPAPFTERDAYISGSIRLHGPSFVDASVNTSVDGLNGSVLSSLIQNAYVLPRLKNGTAEYYLFVEWFDDGTLDNHTNTSLARVYVGRSTSPTGPFYDRLGYDMSQRSRVVIGAHRQISIVSARWGANCDGAGYDVRAVAKQRCENKASCDWAVSYRDLVPLDPLSYSDYDNPPSSASSEDQYTNATINIPDHPGCRRALNVTYRCHKGSIVLYESEVRGEEKTAFLPANASDGDVVQLRCVTPEAVLLPGGSLFADSQRLGGNLHFLSLSHTGVFAYARDGSVRFAFTFQYQTSRSSMPEFGARLIRFTKDGWPVLDEDKTNDWASCGVPEATYSRIAPASYFQREAHYDPAHRDQAHYGSVSSTGTHCRYHSQRGSHCVGNALRATHPQIGSPGPVGDLLHGRIDEQGSPGWWREQEDHCNPMVETILGRTLHCTRFAGIGDLDPTGHITTMERIRGCPELACQKHEGECKRLAQLRVAAWDTLDFFDGGVPVEITRRGREPARIQAIANCHAAPNISRINPSLANVEGGSAITVFGTGFGQPARCRFGWRETPAINVTSHQMVCVSQPLNLTHPESVPWTRARLLRYPFPLEVSMMSTQVLELTPMNEAVREARGENFTSAGRIFEFYNPGSIIISFVQPMGGPSAGSTHIDLHGAGFPKLPDDPNAVSNAQCRFELDGRQVLMPATYHNTERMSCFTPVFALPLSASEVATVQLTFDGQRFVEGDGRANYTFYSLQNRSNESSAITQFPSVAISAIDPLGGPSRGGTRLTLFGRGFAALDNPNRFVQSIFNHQDTRLRPQPTRRTVATSTGTLTYTEWDDPITDPLHDPYRHIISPAGLFCLFAGVQPIVPGAYTLDEDPVRREYVPGTATASEVMHCVTPPHPDWESNPWVNTSVPLEITLNGNRHEVTDSGLTFTYYRDEGFGRPRLSAAQPFGGPFEGGTAVNISGAFINKLTLTSTPVCRFGNGAEQDTVPATVIAHGDDRGRATVRCVSPPLSDRDDRVELGQRDVSLNVAQNGQDFLWRPLRFNFYRRDKLVISTLQPSGGPVLGGTMVALRGRHIGLSRGGVRCQFGLLWVPATVINEDDVRCRSPAQAPALTANETYVPVAVRVTVNGDPVAHSYSLRPFTYFVMPDALVVSSILPLAGLAMGGSAVTVKGRGFRDLGGVYCTFGNSAPVIAERAPPPPPPRPPGGVDGSVRLVNGGGLLNQGRVEIYHDGQWGTVCDDFWDMNDARVVCRQLGFPGALNFTLHGAFGHGSGPIWLDNVRCDPFEERLDRCSSLGWGVHNCDHHEDAGVICAPMPTTSTPSPPPTDPPSPELPWSRLDDFQLTRSPHGAHLDYLAASPIELLRGFNESEVFNEFVCLSPSLEEALGRHAPRVIIRTVELVITLNGGDAYSAVGRNFTYYMD